MSVLPVQLNRTDLDTVANILLDALAEVMGPVQAYGT